MTHIEVSILILCDHDRDSSFFGEPCCSCLLEMFIAKTLLGLLTAKDVLLFLIGDALMALLVALGLLQFLFATDLTALPTLAFTLSPPRSLMFKPAEDHWSTWA